MKYSSAIFLVLIIVQAAYATKDIVEFLQTSDEGREIAENLFLEVSLKGKNFNSGLVNGILKGMGEAVRDATKARALRERSNAAHCKVNIKSARGTYHQLTYHSLVASRHLNGVSHRQKRRQVFLGRAADELAHYKAFYGWVQANGKAWKKYFQETSNNIEKVIGLLSSASSHIRSLKKHAAFVELPGEYSQTLTQLTAEFDATNDNLGGLRAVISNVLELVQKKGHVAKVDFRRKARSLIRHIIDRLGEFQNELSEENEAQEGLFDSLTNLFRDAIDRAEKVANNLNKEVKANAQKIAFLKQAVKGSANLAQEGLSVVNQLVGECRYFKEKNYRRDIRDRRILSAIANFREAIIDRFGDIKNIIIKPIAPKKLITPLHVTPKKI